VTDLCGKSDEHFDLIKSVNCFDQLNWYQ